MIRVEQDMLVLDSTISKKDVQAINEFLEITKRQERERIIKSLQDQAVLCGKGSRDHGMRCALRIVGGGCNCNEVIALIKGEK